MSSFIRFPWATTGEKEAIPATTQSGGDVSLQEGYGEDYSRDLRNDPDAKAIERAKFNWFMNLVSAAVRFLQTNNGVPEFITSTDNGGTAYSYKNGARVRYDAGSGYQTYQSRKDNNTSLPTVTDDWFVVDPNSNLAPGQVTNTQISGTAGIAATKIADGSVSNDAFQYLAGATSNIQTQLAGKQPTGNYLTGLTGDVSATGPGAGAATLTNVGVTPGSYYNANVQVDAKGRVVAAETGANPFMLLEGFETWVGGLPTDLSWTSPDTTNISESAMHVTQGVKSLAFTGTAELTATGVDLTPFGEVNLDVFVGTAPAGSLVRLTVGAETIETPTATTGTFKLRCPVPDGATTIKIESVSGALAWVDNLQSIVLINAEGVSYDGDIPETNVRDALNTLNGTFDDYYTKSEVDTNAVAPGAFGGQLLHVQDQKSTGTDGGSFNAGAHRTRTLNTVLTNEITGASLLSNQITLPAGTYYLEASAPANAVQRHAIRISNVTDAATIFEGTAAFAGSGNLTRSFAYGRFTIADTKTIEMGHRCEVTKTGNGFGVATGFVSVEIYSDLKIWKVG